MTQIHPLWLVVFTLGVAIVPLLAGVATSYIKVSIVFSMLRNGLGAQQLPSGLVVMVLSLALTLYVMSPVFSRSLEIAAQLDPRTLLNAPGLEGLKPLAGAVEPWREFMERHSGQREVETLRRLAGGSAELERPSERVSLNVIIPAFVMTELKEGFAMGFSLLLPLLVIDLIVANILSGLGMFMVSPLLISLPLKLLLFTLCDGWLLISQALINSYQL